MADAFVEMLEVDNTLVRKWGRALIAVQDYSEPIPETFFTEDGVPILPESARQLGFITTDGITAARAVSSTDTQMMQWLDPVRSDLESLGSSYACQFGEGSNAWVQAVYNAQQVKDFPEKAKAPWVFGPDTEISDYPYYRLWAIMADGVGDQAFYRVEYSPRAKVTALTDRTLSRANPETIGFTFTAFKDITAGGLPTWNMENGPGFGAGEGEGEGE